MCSSRIACKLMYIEVLIVIIARQSVYAIKAPLRVVNGEPDTDKTFPFAVLLMDLYEEKRLGRGCTGSLISHIWTITAAHCISEEDKQPYLIGYINLTTTSSVLLRRSLVLQRIVHPFYMEIDVDNEEGGLALFAPDNKQARRRTVLLNDIALLLVERVKFNQFAKISAVDHLSLIGHSAKYAGYGKVDIVETKTSARKPLQVAEAVITQCDKDHILPAICFNSKCGKNQISHSGDSGGPLLFDGKLVGVCSIFNIYTAVSPYLTWIQDTVRRASTESANVNT